MLVGKMPIQLQTRIKYTYVDTWLLYAKGFRTYRLFTTTTQFTIVLFIHIHVQIDGAVQEEMISHQYADYFFSNIYYTLALKLTAIWILDPKKACGPTLQLPPIL